MTRQFVPFSPGERTYPPLSPDVAAQLRRIPTTSALGLTYHPCRATLTDGSSADCVFVVEAKPYIRVWGVWPDQDRAKREIKIQDVAHVEESPCRLPAPLAQRLYDAGESGMGYLLFEISYRDGSRSAHVCGGAVDFVCLPIGKTMTDIVDVYPHRGREAKFQLNTPEYFWCLYGKG